MRFVQILNSKAHWIFEAEQCPEFASDIVIKDISANPEIKEGWSYNVDTDTFSAPIIQSSVLESKLSLEEQVQSLKEDNLILMDAFATMFEEILTLKGEII